MDGRGGESRGRLANVVYEAFCLGSKSVNRDQLRRDYIPCSYPLASNSHPILGDTQHPASEQRKQTLHIRRSWHYHARADADTEGAFSVPPLPSRLQTACLPTPSHGPSPLSIRRRTKALGRRTLSGKISVCPSLRFSGDRLELRELQGGVLLYCRRGEARNLGAGACAHVASPA